MRWAGPIVCKPLGSMRGCPSPARFGVTRTGGSAGLAGGSAVRIGIGLVSTQAALRFVSQGGILRRT